MSLTEQISAPLRRPIQSGAKYNSLIPKADCTIVSEFGNNKNTIEGVEFMSQMAKKYSHQVKKLAKKLQKNTLKETVKTIDDFLFNHIQYQADSSLQQLRSPACSWSDRQKGIDCKSYSLFAVCLLRELGITSYFRQIKQPYFYPDQFTHIYVIVPKDQTSATDVKEFKGDYFVIDPTDKTKKEPASIKKLDKIMSGLTYVGLNAPKQQNTATLSANPLNFFQDNAKAFKAASFSRQTFVNLTDFIRNLIAQGYSPSREIRFKFTKEGIIIYTNSLKKIFRPDQPKNGNWIKDFIRNLNDYQNIGLNASSSSDSDIINDAMGAISSGELDGIIGDLAGIFGGILSPRGWYKGDKVKADAKKIANHFAKIISEINKAARNRNNSLLSKHVNDFKADALAITTAIKAKLDEGWSSKTTEPNLRTILSFSKKYSENSVQALEAWLNKYFDKTSTSEKLRRKSSEIENIFDSPRPAYVRPEKVVFIDKHNYTLKSGIQKVLSFEVNKYVLDANSGRFNSGGFLKNLTNILFDNTGSGSNNSGGGSNNTGGGSNNTGGNSHDFIARKPVNSASIGGISTNSIALVGGGIAAAYFLPKLIEMFQNNQKKQA